MSETHREQVHVVVINYSHNNVVLNVWFCVKGMQCQTEEVNVRCGGGHI